MPATQHPIRMPTPPGVVVKLLELTEKEHASVHEIADVISLDPALAAKIMKFANSPLAGIRREVTSLPRAVALMGTRGVMMTALSFAVVGATRIESCLGFNVKQFGLQSIACGVAARALAARNNTAAPQEAMLTGLLSQLGRAVLANTNPDNYALLLQRVERIPLDLPELELELFGTDYAQIGADMLQAWGLPGSVWMPLRRYRLPPEKTECQAFDHVIFVAERMAGVVCPDGNCTEPDTAGLLQSARQRLGIEQDECEILLCEVAEETESLRISLDVAPGDVRPPEQIRELLQERITVLNLAMHFEHKEGSDDQGEMLRKASTDPLTRAGNRAAFETRIKPEIDRSRRTGQPLGLIIIDIDRLKQLNDTHGNAAGDEVLKAVAATLGENIRKIDYVARVGADEFAVIAPGLTRETASTLAERIRAIIAEIGIKWNGNRLDTTVSLGAAVVSAFPEHDPERFIIRSAVHCVDEAKRAGRNCCIYAFGNDDTADATTTTKADASTVQHAGIETTAQD